MRSWRNARKRPFCPPVFAPLFDMAGCFSPGCRAQGGRWRKGRGKTACADQRRAALRFAPRVCSEPGCEGRKGQRGGIRLQGDNRKWALRLARHLQRPRAPKAALLAPAGRLRTGAQAADRQRGLHQKQERIQRGPKRLLRPFHQDMTLWIRERKIAASAGPAPGLPEPFFWGPGCAQALKSLPTRWPGPGAGPAGRARGPRCGPPFRRCWRGAGRGRGWAGR